MPCYFPLHGYRSNKLSENGKRQFVFSRKNGYVDQALTVPCGQCLGCRIDRSREWALRCVHESRFHKQNSFITLTYDDEHLPIDGSLDKTHLQKFFKRLRKKLGQFRYFSCGEYGDTSSRPHYHAIIFGVDFSEDRQQVSKNKQGNILYSSETLSQAWGMGNCWIGNFTYQTAAYTARYVMKKQIGKNGSDHPNYSRLNVNTGELIQVAREFACMSMRPGLGSAWYDKFKSDAFPSDFLVHEGKKHPVPRFYVNKLKEGNSYEFDLIAKKRKKAREENSANSTTDRLRVRHEVKKSQLSKLTRSL